MFFTSGTFYNVYDTFFMTNGVPDSPEDRAQDRMHALVIQVMQKKAQDFYAQFSAEVAGLVTAARDRLNKLMSNDPQNASEERAASLVVEDWMRRKSQELCYARYCSLMREITKEPISFQAFTSSSNRISSSSPYSNFRYIEEQGIKIGDIVCTSQAATPHTVVGITIDAKFSLRAPDGAMKNSVHPIGWIKNSPVV